MPEARQAPSHGQREAETSASSPRTEMLSLWQPPAGGRVLVNHVVVVIAQSQFHGYKPGSFLHPGEERGTLLFV